MRGPARKRRAVAGAKPLKAGKHQEGSGLPVMVHPIAGGCRIFAESKALKATLATRWVFGFARFSYSSRANVTKVTASERGQRLCEGEKPWRTNPMSGTGMKQGRKVLEDVSRQEGEKP